MFILPQCPTGQAKVKIRSCPWSLLCPLHGLTSKNTLFSLLSLESSFIWKHLVPCGHVGPAAVNLDSLLLGDWNTVLCKPVLKTFLLELEGNNNFPPSFPVNSHSKQPIPVMLCEWHLVFISCAVLQLLSSLRAYCSFIP